MSAREKQFSLYITSLRIEELIGLLFLVVTIPISIILNTIAILEEVDQLPGAALGIWRSLISLALVIIFLWLIHFHNERKQVKVVRDFAPFLFTIVIYMNLHDAIRVINPHDIHYGLIAVEEWIFGIQPTVWIERFYHPFLTDWFSFSYLTYYGLTLTLLVWLYRKNYYDKFRTVVLAGMFANFIGFLGYVVFPASSPYVIMPELFAVDIWDNTGTMSDFVRAVVNLSPDRVRDAFPSLHNGITLLTMILAWRFNRVIFWIFFPLALSLPVATVYLRYHFVVDIFAGFAVTFLALWISPWFDEKWKSFQKEQEGKLEVLAQ